MKLKICFDFQKDADCVQMKSNNQNKRKVKCTFVFWWVMIQICLWCILRDTVCASMKIIHFERKRLRFLMTVQHLLIEINLVSNIEGFHVWFTTHFPRLISKRFSLAVRLNCKQLAYFMDIKKTSHSDHTVYIWVIKIIQLECLGKMS